MLVYKIEGKKSLKKTYLHLLSVIFVLIKAFALDIYKLLTFQKLKAESNFKESCVIQENSLIH